MGMIFKTDGPFPVICVESCGETSPNVFSVYSPLPFQKSYAVSQRAWVPVKVVMSAFLPGLY